MSVFEIAFVVVVFSVGLAWAFIRHRNPRNRWKSRAHRRWYLLARD